VRLGLVHQEFHLSKVSRALGFPGAVAFGDQTAAPAGLTASPSLWLHRGTLINMY
jgi:hypothetical protein